MIGTLFLWVFFPSLNAATTEPEDARHRAIMNTYLSMVSCTVTTFLVSSLSDAFGRFNMLHIQSSTLAGGIAIGTVANVILYPHHAIIVGFITGVLSVVGHVAVTALSVFFALWNNPADYGPRIHKIYPYYKGGERGGDRDQYIQALFQLSGIFITLLAAILSGIFTGLIVRLRIWYHIPNQISWEDTNYYKGAQFALFGK
uniref:Ammonium transporter AmtB-like domain-containing protein n=1 Tax=Panagrolaimus sp. ES5 TaxID=591445 RepID=A0AC34FXL5_9BILA